MQSCPYSVFIPDLIQVCCRSRALYLLHIRFEFALEVIFSFLYMQVMKLRKELESAKEKVFTLTSQLTTNVSFLQYHTHIYLL